MAHRAEPVIELLERQLDHGYLAAARSSVQYSDPTRNVLKSLAIIVSVLIGFLIAVAYTHTEDNAPQTARTKKALIGKIAERRDELSVLTNREDELSANISKKKKTVKKKSAQLAAAKQHTDELRAVAGVQSLRGPGLVVKVADGPTPTAHITDRDLHELINALWSAGAEGIAIDGQRLTSVSAIRSAGEAILVDYHPVTNPYEISVVGNTSSVRSEFEKSEVAQRFRSYVTTYSMGFEVVDKSRVELPASAIPSMHFAKERLSE